MPPGKKSKKNERQNTFDLAPGNDSLQFQGSAPITNTTTAANNTATNSSALYTTSTINPSQYISIPIKVPNNSQQSVLLTHNDDNKFEPYQGNTNVTPAKTTDMPTNENEKMEQSQNALQNSKTFKKNGKKSKSKDSGKPATVVQENIKKNKTTDMRQRLKKSFRVMHIIFVVSGIGLMAAGFCVDYVISKMWSTLRINLADQSKKIYIGSGAAIIVVAIVGHIVVLLHRLKILSWLIYLLVIFVGACSTGTAGFTSLTIYKNHTIPRAKLLDLMTAYNGKSGNATIRWDAVHQGYECCGVDNFTNWDASPFGRTSLRTPMSCCRSHRTVKDEFCGQNLLPTTKFEVANKIIYARGCINVMLHDLDLWYLITGLYATAVTLIVSFHFIFCFFLIASHRL